MSTFTLTKDGFKFKNATDQIKSITINDAANQIDFQQLSVATPFIENKEYVSPQEQVGEIIIINNDQGGDDSFAISSPDSWIVEMGENHGFFALSSPNVYRLTRPGYRNHEHFVSLYDNQIKWITGADKDRLGGVVSATSISWSDQTTWTKFVSGD